MLTTALIDTNHHKPGQIVTNLQKSDSSSIPYDRYMLTQNCPQHRYNSRFRFTEHCGCPATNRTQGFLVYRDQHNTLNWVVWDCTRWEWIVLAGDWQTAMNAAISRLKALQANRESAKKSGQPGQPRRCEARCSQWPNCKHDWSYWDIHDRAVD